MSISSTDLLLAEQLVGRGISLAEVAKILGVSDDSLKSLAEKTESEAALRQGYEGADGTQSLKEFAGAFLEQWPGNPLGLSEKRPWLSISAKARRLGWTKGAFRSPTALSSGRPRVDNCDEKLVSAANTAVVMARNDTQLNLKLAVIRAAGQHGVTDLNGMMPHLKTTAPDLWRGRKVTG